MTEYLKLIIIAQLAIAILILPSSASLVCNCSGADPDCDNFSSQCEAQTCFEYCTSSGMGYLSNQDGYDKDGTVCEDRPGPSCLPPVACDSNVTMVEATTVEITLSATDPEGDTMTYTIVSGPSDGILEMTTGNTVVYTPEANYTGFDSFSFRANDGTWDSNNATVSIFVEPGCSPFHVQTFYGNVTIDGEPAPEYTVIQASGPGVRSNITGNPVATQTDGSYGSANATAQKLVVKGCIEDGAPLAFSVDGVPAEVSEINTSGGPWQSTHPFRAGGVTNLNLRVTPPPPPPDSVYINALGVTLSNPTYGYTQTIKVEKQPWIELRVTKGVFDIQISASGYHDFTDYPMLGRNATLGIYENGIPVSTEVPVAFGSRTASYEYRANETRTFDILIFVNESPEINDVKHMTIYAVSGSDDPNITPDAGTGGSISSAGQVSGDAGAAQRVMALPLLDVRSLM
jgi:hypothetical protein